MNLNMALSVIFGSITFVGITFIMVQVYFMIVIDAKARGLKHPKFWALFAMSGNNSSGLITYLIGRKKYPIINISKENAEELEKRKKSILVGFVFLVIGIIGLVATIIFK